MQYVIGTIFCLPCWTNSFVSWVVETTIILLCTWVPYHKVMSALVFCACTYSFSIVLLFSYDLFYPQLNYDLPNKNDTSAEEVSNHWEVAPSPRHQRPSSCMFIYLTSSLPWILLPPYLLMGARHQVRLLLNFLPQFVCADNLFFLVSSWKYSNCYLKCSYLMWIQDKQYVKRTSDLFVHAGLILVPICCHGNEISKA